MKYFKKQSPRKQRDDKMKKELHKLTRKHNPNYFTEQIVRRVAAEAVRKSGASAHFVMAK
ncbi:MAG: hypothetical protein V3U16_03580 [Candidatus Neomarinimicrobiota bacterium]